MNEKETEIFHHESIMIEVPLILEDILKENIRKNKRI